MSTIYTLNGKVLKNSANDKWLAKKEGPAGFVMNASNAIYTLVDGSYYVSWRGPAYPDGYNGNGKQYTLVNNNEESPNGNPLVYATSPSDSGGPKAILALGMIPLGESTGTLLNNVAGGDYGSYIVWPCPIESSTLEQVQAYMANVSITIVDP